MKNSDYWEQRFTQLENAQNKLGQEAFKEIETQYREAMKQIEAQISTWYQRFAKNNGITLAEARQWLSGKDLKEFKWDVKDYIKYGEQNALTGEWIKELENASAKYHISKFEALKVHIRQNLESLFSKQGDVISDTLSKVYTSGYYHTAYEIQKGFRIGWDIAGVDKSKLEKILAKPWAADGYNFSDRIWRNKDKLISEVYKELSQNIMLGADPQRAINSLAKKMNTSKYNAGRLVMTEEAYFSSTAQKEAFRELNVEEFKVVATLDSHTSEICRQMDGKHFPMTDYQPGTTAPPFHVYCRSTTAPYFADMEGIGERFARDANGKTYEVSADMTYDEWVGKFVKTVENLPESGIIKSGGISGALNPNSSRAQKYAEQYYESVRKMKTDCRLIAKNTGYTEEQINAVKNYIFINKHDLGQGDLERFAPSYEMAQSWQRLIDGKDIQLHDLTLIKHEIMEKELISKGMTQEEAHIVASRVYNYRKECEEYYAKTNKHKKK